MAYYEYILTRSGTAGALSVYFFTANGLFDPNITGTGHQPMGFDTMMQYYEQYTVIRSKITVVAYNTGVLCPVRVAVSLSPDTTSPVLPGYVECGQIEMVSLDCLSATVYGSQRGLKTLNLNCDVARYFGRANSRELLDDPNLYGTVAANPVEQVYFAIAAWGFEGQNWSISFDVVLEYDVIFWEPRQVAAQEQKLPPSCIKTFTRFGKTVTPPARSAF
jgi:hypothetical protein